MKIMVIGGGGREHTVIKCLKKSPKVSEIFALPGNGGIAADATCIDIGAKDIEGVVRFAVQNKIDYAVVTPDDPLVLGMVDALNDVGVPCFGPNKAAAVIEGSKAFSKDLMKKYNIPTAEYEIFEDMDKAVAYVETLTPPVVVKADGLALGKGVIIAETTEEAVNAVNRIMGEKAFGASGNRVVVEEFLTGPEISVLSFTDGETVVPMVSSMDHKRIGNGNTGLNTGGMGTVAPNPYYTEDIAKQCMDEIFMPTIRAMKAEGRAFSGCLYFGLMLTSKGPKVIEYNCRFGDPEAQVVLPLLESDLLDIMFKVTAGNLKSADISFSKQSACCVVLASAGYPVSYEKGFEITVETDSDTVFFAGASLKDGKLVTNGGRVVGVTALGDDLKSAIDKAYKDAANVKFDNSYCRIDIGRTALAALEG